MTAEDDFDDTVPVDMHQPTEDVRLQYEKIIRDCGCTDLNIGRITNGEFEGMIAIVCKHNAEILQPVGWMEIYTKVVKLEVRSRDADDEEV